MKLHGPIDLCRGKNERVESIVVMATVYSPLAVSLAALSPLAGSGTPLGTLKWSRPITDLQTSLADWLPITTENRDRRGVQLWQEYRTFRPEAGVQIG